MAEVVEYALLAAGVVGYAVAFFMVATLRRWLGGRYGGWPRILTNALVALLALLALLFAVSLATRLGLLGRGLRFVLSYATVVALVAAPWCLAAALHVWRRRAMRQGERR